MLGWLETKKSDDNFVALQEDKCAVAFGRNPISSFCANGQKVAIFGPIENNRKGRCQAGLYSVYSVFHTL